jgi:4-hydroxythreonine-4-phosphate dehydrogenase
MLLAGSPFEDELRFFVHELEWSGLHGELNVLDDLWTSRVTSHVPIREVSSLINERRVYEAIVLIDSAMRSYGYTRPRIAVSALNPHSGEGGFFGQEERESIAPAIEKAKAQGIDANGPFSADTIFLRAKRDDFDGIVSMYHDQGQIAMKLMGFERSITINGGLPIPITTPAHGTAHDIAGRGIANSGALKRALFVASRMASNAKE